MHQQQLRRRKGSMLQTPRRGGQGASVPPRCCVTTAAGKQHTWYICAKSGPRKQRRAPCMWWFQSGGSRAMDLMGVKGCARWSWGQAVWCGCGGASVVQRLAGAKQGAGWGACPRSPSHAGVHRATVRSIAKKIEEASCKSCVRGPPCRCPCCVHAELVCGEAVSGVTQARHW